MIGWLILAGYVAGWIISSPILTRAMAYDEDPEFLDAAMGSMTGLLWPLLGIPAIALWLARRETPSERRDRITVERDARVREQSLTIARLEREAGIR